MYRLKLSIDSAYDARNKLNLVCIIMHLHSDWMVSNQANSLGSRLVT